MTTSQPPSADPDASPQGASQSGPSSQPDPVTATGRRFSAQWRWLSWILALIVVASALVIGVVDAAPPQSQAEQVQRIARTIRCPQCQGQSVAESDVAVARQIRADIARRVGEGQSTAEIQQAYIDDFDDPSIVLTPPADGISAALWVVPLVGAALATVALGFALLRWQREAEPTGAVSDEDRALVDNAIQANRGE